MTYQIYSIDLWIDYVWILIQIILWGIANHSQNAQSGLYCTFVVY